MAPLEWPLVPLTVLRPGLDVLPSVSVFLPDHPSRMERLLQKQRLERPALGIQTDSAARTATPLESMEKRPILGTAAMGRTGQKTQRARSSIQRQASPETISRPQTGSQSPLEQAAPSDATINRLSANMLKAGFNETQLSEAEWMFWRKRFPQ